jgi:hypothetical protein
MKKSADLSQAFLLKQFPGRRKLSSTIPSETFWRNSVLLATSALLITLVTSVIFYRQLTSSLETERLSHLALEQRLESLKEESARAHASQREAVERVQAFAQELSLLQTTATKEEKIFWPKMIALIEKHGLSMKNVVEEKGNNSSEKDPSVAQGQAPW